MLSRNLVEGTGAHMTLLNDIKNLGTNEKTVKRQLTSHKDVRLEVPSKYSSTQNKVQAHKFMTTIPR
jgi:hypothetical protein